MFIIGFDVVSMYWNCFITDTNWLLNQNLYMMMVVQDSQVVVTASKFVGDISDATCVRCSCWIGNCFISNTKDRSIK